MSSNDWRAFVRARLNSAASYLSRAYVAGPELADALATFDRCAQRGQRATIGYFNTPRQPARTIADIDLAVLAALGDGRPDGYLSIKGPPLQFDPALVDEIAQRAAATGVGLHFDAHGIDTTDPTFAAIERTLRHTALVGCTLPARWPRSLADSERAVDWQLRVRVVKGQWADPAHPDVDIDSAYLRLIEGLAGRARAVAVATHDPRLARRALIRLRATGTACELEMLLGLPMRAVSAVARELGVPQRVYIPFGAAWMPYALGELSRRPERVWWMLKDALLAAAPRRLG